MVILRSEKASKYTCPVHSSPEIPGTAAYLLLSNKTSTSVTWLTSTPTKSQNIKQDFP